MKLDFTGKQIVVTGGTAGMGLAAVKAFCESGGTVYTCARREQKLQNVLEELSVQGYRVAGIPCDVSDETSMRSFGAWVSEQTGGKVDVWINNAGGMHRGRLVEEKTEDFCDVIRRNVLSVLWGSQEAALRMGEGGVIINAGSYSGGKPSVNQGAYSASKAAVTSLTATLASELAPRGIRVVGYAPGSIYTEMTHPSALTNMDALKRIPQRRMGRPEEVADLILFLASPHSAYINGVCVPIDGGKLTTQAPEDGWK